MQVTVKTLDSETRVFSVSEEATVEEFKTQIASEVGIPVERQRLIFKGKVLQDSTKLQIYGVDGCVVHLVERRPPTSGTRSVPDGASSERSNQQSSGQSGDGHVHGPAGGFNLSTDVMNLSQQIVQGLVSQLGLNSAQANVSTSQSGDGSTLNVHINLLASANAASDAGLRIARARQFLRAARNSLNRSEGESSVLPEPGVAMDTSSPTSESQPSTTEQTNSGSQAGNNQNNTPSTLADVLGELQEMSTTLQPHLQRYRTLLSASSTEDLLPSDDSLPDRVAEALHNLSHAYHALSDLTFNFRSPEPRRLSVLPPLSNHVGAAPFLSSLFSGGQTPTTQTGQQPAHANTDARIHVVPGGSAIAFTSIISGSLPPSGIYNQQPSTTTMGGANRPGSVSVNLGQGNQGNNHQGNNQRTTGTSNGTTTSSSSTPQGNGSENVRIVMDDFVALFSNAGHPVTSHSETSRTSTTTPSQGHSQGDTDTQTQNSGTTGASRTIPRINIGSLPLNSNHPDPSVPCESFHFGPRSHQPQGPQTGGSSSSQANQNGGLAQTFSDVVASVIQDTITGRPSSDFRAAGQPGSTTSSDTNTQSSNGTSTQANSNSTTEVSEALNPLIQLLSGFHGQQSSQQSTNQNQSSQQEQRSTEFRGFDMNILHLLMNTLGGRGDGDASQQNIHDFLHDIDEAVGGSDDDSPSIFEGPLINQLMDRVGNSMLMHDLMLLLMGLREPYARLHGVLHVYLFRDLLDGDPSTDQNLQRAASRIASELVEGLSDTLTAVPAADNVDIKASMSCFLEHAIHRSLIMTRDLDNDTFSADFPIHFRQSMHDLCILLTMCLRDGVHGVENLLNIRLPVSSLTRDVTPLMLQTFQTTAVQFLHNAHAQRRQREDTLRQFIKTQETQPVDVPAPAADGHSPAEAGEDNSQKSDDSDGFVTPPLSMSANDIEEYAPLEDQAEDAMELDEGEDDDWKAVVPEDWVPIIARDVIRQRRLPQQAPFSDSYLSGLPPKRRKTVDQRALSSTSENIPSILRQAVIAAGVTPRTSMEAVTTDARHSSDLHEAYRDEVKKAVKTRTSKDTDYTPDKFPSTKDYLEKS